ncbi:hypothetical protein B0O99DRAFT_710020, partial [Bisporella sp. PMI_857]
VITGTNPRFFLSTYNNVAIQYICSYLSCRRASACAMLCDDSQASMGGSHNWANVLIFDDNDVEWIFRSPRVDNGISEQTMTKLIESEVASTKYSRLNGIPVVEVKVTAMRAPGFSVRNKIGSLCERDGEFHTEECLLPPPALTWPPRDPMTSREVYSTTTKGITNPCPRTLLPRWETTLRASRLPSPSPKLKSFLSLSSYRSAVQLWNDFVAISMKSDSRITD